MLSAIIYGVLGEYQNIELSNSAFEVSSAIVTISLYLTFSLLAFSLDRNF